VPRRTAVRLTQNRIDQHRSAGAPAFIWDTDVPGLGVEAVPDRKSWVYSYRLGGKAKRITIGKVPGMSLDDARDEARRHAMTLRQGDDPALARRRVTAADTLSKLRGRYIETAHFLSRSPDFRANFASTWRRYIAPRLGHLAVPAIRRIHVVELVDELRKAGKPGMAAGARTHLSLLLEFAVERDLIGANPARGVRAPPAGRRTKWLRTEKELRDAWNIDTHPDTQRLVRFIMLTGCRRDEARLLTWRQVHDDFIEWQKTKAGHQHSLPIMPMMRQVLGDRGEGYVFGDQPRGTFNWRVNTATGSVWSAHVLRHSVETHLAELGVSEEVRDAVLNHQRRSTGARYMHGRQLQRKQAALAVWHGHLARALRGRRKSAKNGK
jgi:integrase